jgi:hypothetical protein
VTVVRRRRHRQLGVGRPLREPPLDQSVLRRVARRLDTGRVAAAVQGHRRRRLHRRAGLQEIRHPTKVLAPPYNSNPPGISDHKYVTQWLKDGTHTDVGNNFPWDVFTAAVNKYATGAPAQPPGVPVPAPNVPDYNKETWDQIRGRWAMLGNQTMVEALAQIRDKTCGTSDAGKPGVTF